MVHLQFFGSKISETVSVTLRRNSDSLVWRQRLRCFGHEERDSGYIRERMLNMELPGGKKIGRPQRRFTDVVKGHGEICGLQ